MRDLIVVVLYRWEQSREQREDGGRWTVQMYRGHYTDGARRHRERSLTTVRTMELAGPLLTITVHSENQ